jgi:hypothetical protein
MISFHGGKTLSEQEFNGNGICITPARRGIHAGDQIKVTARNGRIGACEGIKEFANLSFHNPDIRELRR